MSVSGIKPGGDTAVIQGDLRALGTSLATALTLALTVVLAVLPIGALLYASVLSDSPGTPGATLTLKSWAQLLTTANLPAMQNTFLVSVCVTVASVAVGAFLAWIVGRTDTPYRRQFRILFILPMLFSPVLTTIAWTILANPRVGLLNDWARHVIPGSWTLVNVYSIGGMVLVESLFFIPFAYLLIVGILDTLNPSLEDASRTAGAGVLTTLRRVTLPLVTPGIAAASLLIFSLASEQFIVPVVIGLRARIPTLQYELYLSMVDSPSRPNYAAAIGCLLLVITIVGFFLNSRATRFQRRFITVTGKASAPKPVALGPWRYLTCGLAILYLLIAVAAPYGTLLLVSLMRYFTPEITPNLFTLQNYAQLASLGTTALALRNTFLYALLAATVTLGLSGGISYLVSRSESRWPRVIGFLAMLPLSVPAISLGLGILWAYLFIPTGVYGTPWILLIAYVTRFMPQGIRGISASLTQIDPELEQAARVHGAGAGRAVAGILVPLARSALLAAWTLIFVQVTLEVSMTLMLYTSKTMTAAIDIWFTYFGGNTNVAFSLAAILATFSFVAIALSQWLFGALRRGV